MRIREETKRQQTIQLVSDEMKELVTVCSERTV